MSCLVAISGSTKGRTFQVSPDRDNVIGRVSGCDVCIVDTRISRRHCVISAGEAGYLIRDLGSANGILVNGVKVSEAALKDEDKIRMGVTELEFHQTERFEDAETKRLAPGEQAAPDLQRSARKPAKSLGTQSLEFCSRCSGSIPATDLASGRARKVGGKLVCTECLAHQRAKVDAAAVVEAADPAAGEQAEDAREKTSAEEVSKLAAELAEQAPSPLEGKAASKPPRAEEPEEASPAEDAVPVEVEDEDEELNTDALMIPEGTFDDPQPAGASPEPEETKAEEVQPPKAQPPKARAVTAPAEETVPLDVAKVIEKAKEAKKVEDISAAKLYDEALLEPEEIIELDDDGLPKLPSEKDLASLDEDAKTPRPGSEIRVL